MEATVHFRMGKHGKKYKITGTVLYHDKWHTVIKREKKSYVFVNSLVKVDFHEENE